MSCLKIVFTRCKYARKQHEVKRQVCQQFERTGSCRRGTDCSFAHGSSELGQPTVAAATARAEASSWAPDGKRRRTDGEDRRLDPSDGELYSRDEFISCYGSTKEWESAAPQKRRPGGPVPVPVGIERLPDGFTKGESYVVQGLSSTHSILNGLVGTVLRAQKGRIIVDIPSHGERAMRAECLVPVDQHYSAVD